MKWLRLSVLWMFFFCVFGCFYKSPFAGELSVFILPEISLNASIVRNDVSIFGVMTDVRADYVQTEHNFSNYHGMDFEHKDQLLRIFEDEAIRASKILVNGQPLWNYKKAKFRVNKPVVWPRKTLKPIKITSEL